MRTALAVLATSLALTASACSGDGLDVPRGPIATTLSPAPAPASTPTSAPPPTDGRQAAHFTPARAMRTVRHLAGVIGPRLATGPAFREAADYVTDRFAGHGYTVTRSAFPVPAGDSWGVPVGAGRSFNVIATPPGYDPAAPHVLVGAHLDTVAVAPGAEDNASGVAVLLELARVIGNPQVVFVAFGGEEPRGPGDLHHFGSKDYVAALSEDEGYNLHGMVALDRVGVGRTVPLSSVDGTPAALREQLAGIADDLHVPHVVGTDSASDHESFADAGFLAARVGSTPYAGYHSAADVPSVVRPGQLGRVGRILTSWLRGR